MVRRSSSLLEFPWKGNFPALPTVPTPFHAQKRTFDFSDVYIPNQTPGNELYALRLFALLILKEITPKVANGALGRY